MHNRNEIYIHGDIVKVKNAGGKKSYPCVVLRHARLRDDAGTDYIVAMRTNNPAFIRAYEPEVSMEFSIGEKRKGFITTSPVFIPEKDIVEVIGRLTDVQLAEFDEMLLKCVGVDIKDNVFKEMYYQLKSEIAGLIT